MAQTSVLDIPVSHPHRSGGVHVRVGTRSWADRLAIGMIVGAWALGTYFRLWFIFHAPISSDESIVGMIAQGFLHGHFTAFYGGQTYGGTAEPFLISLAFAVFGQSGVVEAFVVGILAALAALLTVRVAKRMRVPVRVAQLTGALAWVAPAVTVRDSVRTYGFRGVAIVCGVGLLLAALRVLDGDLRVRNFIAIGALVGIGWWSTPEIGYFAVPAVLLVGGAIVRERNARSWFQGLAVTLLTAVVTSLPWLWANVESNFASLNFWSRERHGTYVHRLEGFFHYTFPMQTGSIMADTGTHILGWLYVPALVVMSAAIIGAIVMCLVRGGRAAAIGSTVVLFPLMYALPPPTGAWMDGRYAISLAPLLALTVGIGATESVQRLRSLESAAPLLMSIVVVVSALLCALGLVKLVHAESARFVDHWGNPDAPTLTAIAKLEHDGISTGYADYWVAYKLDFLSKGHLAITVAGYDPDRSKTINSQVLESRSPAWLFVPPGLATLDGTQFTAPKLSLGPANGNFHEAKLIATLRRMQVGYRSFDAGLLIAIVPDRTLTPHQLGVPGAR